MPCAPPGPVSGALAARCPLAVAAKVHPEIMISTTRVGPAPAVAPVGEPSEHSPAAPQPRQVHGPRPEPQAFLARAEHCCPWAETRTKQPLAHPSKTLQVPTALGTGAGEGTGRDAQC